PTDLELAADFCPLGNSLSEGYHSMSNYRVE
ncbi:MAG: hypothetical protein JWO94_3031, partial [Verrucomicrobiaceae bacterium]|nr:hypothetical protein [Verrucomicrobiaceae bacterium]